ncbi:hypothetical protein FQR65_LT04910 [Abscondita terminalis]|nr:hypothetical protein FQR65_LT04910 [Abscondita terminalis]
MPKSGQEVVCEGWLTKSPPTKRIWRARWRRRWFCLQNSGELPGQYCLMYYADRKCRKLKGTINLDACEQVDTGLQFEDSKHKFDFMFDIKTKTRTYYLAAETEEEMKAWVNCICNICGLKATTEDEAVTRSLNPQPPIYQDHPNILLDESSKTALDSPPISPVSTGPYIPISECISGRLPSQGVQDFYTLLHYNVTNSFIRSSSLPKSHNNDTYDTRSPTYLNGINSENDPRFYDCPRSHQIQHNLRKTYKNSEKLEKSINGSPLQSPTDSESVFTDDDWVHNTSAENPTRSLNPSNSSMTEPLLSDSCNRIALDDVGKPLDPPPRPPKPAPNYFNLSQIEISNKSRYAHGISDETYDFPRSHQLDNTENISNTLHRKHCYNNAAPVIIEGEFFRYDISPKPSTSTTQVFQYDDVEMPNEPASPLSQASSTTTAMYSNLPSPLLPSDTQLMPPPQINRSLKPKRKLSDSVSITSSNEPSSPRPAPCVDRTCKPAINVQSTGMRKTFESEGEYSSKYRAGPSPTLPDNLYGNQQMCTLLSSMQYLDLDHSNSDYGSSSSKSQPLRSPDASTVYKQVDFMKTKAFNYTRKCVEKERKESTEPEDDAGFPRPSEGEPAEKDRCASLSQFGVIAGIINFIMEKLMFLILCCTSFTREHSIIIDDLPKQINPSQINNELLSNEMEVSESVDRSIKKPIKKTLQPPLAFSYNNPKEDSVSESTQEKTDSAKKYVKGGGKKSFTHHYSSSGEEGGNKYESGDVHNKNEKGHHSKFEEEGNQDKGHSTKGSHSVNKKDHYEKKTEFYDELFDEDSDESFFDFSKEDDFKKMSAEKSGYNEFDDEFSKYGKESEYENKSNHKSSKQHKKKTGNDKHEEHGSKIGEKSADKQGKAWSFKNGPEKKESETAESKDIRPSYSTKHFTHYRKPENYTNRKNDEVNIDKIKDQYKHSTNAIDALESLIRSLETNDFTFMNDNKTNKNSESYLSNNNNNNNQRVPKNVKFQNRILDEYQQKIETKHL